MTLLATVLNLGAAHGVELRLKHDDAAPMPFAVWCWGPDDDESDADIIGAGQTESEALDAARVQLRAWEERA